MIVYTGVFQIHRKLNKFGQLHTLKTIVATLELVWNCDTVTCSIKHPTHSHTHWNRKRDTIANNSHENQTMNPRYLGDEKAHFAARFTFISSMTVMPRLSKKHRQRSFGRLQTGQNAQIFANAFNVNARTIYCPQEQLCATNSIDDLHYRGRPRVSPVPAGRFIKVTETACHTIGTNRRPLCANTVRRCLGANNVLCRSPLQGPVLTAPRR